MKAEELHRKYVSLIFIPLFFFFFFGGLLKEGHVTKYSVQFGSLRFQTFLEPPSRQQIFSHS